jgi:putative endonuclease
MRQFYVYIMASFRQVLYVGVTSNLARRGYEHKQKVNPRSFTARYNVNRLVYVETYSNARDAIAQEKQIKGWKREKKVALIVRDNGRWRDLSLDWQ